MLARNTGQAGRPPTTRCIMAFSYMLAWSMALIVSACVMIPLPAPDPEIPDEKLGPIVVGKTTRSEIEAVLGKPDIIWETERVWVYEAGTGDRLFVIMGAGPYNAGWNTLELDQQVVMVRFDKDGRVARLERSRAPAGGRDYGKFLREWLAKKKGQPAPERTPAKSGKGT